MSIKKILNSKWIVVLFLLALFPPHYFDQNATIEKVLDVFKLVVWIAVVLLYFANIKIHFRKSYNVVLIILWVELLVSTLLSDDASIHIYALQAMDILLPCFLVGALAVQSPKNGIKAMYYYFSACVLINTITFILFPGALYADAGGWRCWLLGDDNTGYSFYIVASTLAMAYCSNIRGIITAPSILVWISGFIFAFGREIGSGIICQMIWLGLFIIYFFRKLRQFIKARYIFYITAGGFFGIAIFRNLIIESITTAIGKDVTLTGRTQLWDNVIKAVKHRPAFGYGIVEGETFNRLLFTNALGAHNQLLMLMFWGGIIAAVIFAILLCATIKNSAKARQTDFYKCIVIGVVVISIRLLAENGYSNHLYFLLTLLAYSPEFSACLKSANPTKEDKIQSTIKHRD